MSLVAKRFDPWGPISTALYEIGSSDFVLDAIGNTGVEIAWQPLTKDEKYSHGTRIRAFRRDIALAYMGLDPEQRGRFAQIVLKSMLRRHDGDQIRARVEERLGDIGWTIDADGVLRTEDALVSEQFFPPNSEYDAYVAIRDILSEATTNITVVDPYLGSSLLLTLRSLPPRGLFVRFLTTPKNLKPDLFTELGLFRKQVSHIQIEIRTTTTFHDRFIVVDEARFYHVGASIKDAGKRAFMISRLEDQPNIDSLKRYVDEAWTGGIPT